MDLINDNGVHYEYCGKYNDNDAEFVSSLDDITFKQVFEFIDNGNYPSTFFKDRSVSLFEFTNIIIEPLYMSNSNYDFNMEGSMIVLNK